MIQSLVTGARMKSIRVALRSVNDGFYRLQLNRSMTGFAGSHVNNSKIGLGKNDNQSTNLFERAEDFENRIFSDTSGDPSNSFYRTLDRIEKARYGPGMGFTPSGGSSGMFDEGDDSFTTLIDGMDGKLKKAATYFEVNPQEIAAEEYTYRPDINLRPRMTYTPEELNIRKPGVWKPGKKTEFEVTSKEALQNADFRNVRFLANFLTEAGIIIKRTKTGISAKAQRKVAREIKKARAFGLLPFTTMGTKGFVFGKTMENLDHDYELDPYDIQPEVKDPVAE